MAPFMGSAQASLVSGTPDELGDMNVPVDAGSVLRSLGGRDLEPLGLMGFLGFTGYE
jgi:hypothetical protein